MVSSCGAVSWSLSFQKPTRKLNDGSRDEVVDIFSKRTLFSMSNFKPKIGMRHVTDTSPTLDSRCGGFLKKKIKPSLGDDPWELGVDGPSCELMN